MTLRKIYAHLNCSDHNASISWFEKIFDRLPDARPMEGLAEWHHGAGAGFQLFRNPDDAGHGTLTLFVEGLEEKRASLEAAGLAPGPIEAATYVNLVRLRDPDQNLIVLAEQDGAVE